MEEDEVNAQRRIWELMVWGPSTYIYGFRRAISMRRRLLLFMYRMAFRFILESAYFVFLVIHICLPCVFLSPVTSRLLFMLMCPLRASIFCRPSWLFTHQLAFSVSLSVSLVSKALINKRDKTNGQLHARYTGKTQSLFFILTRLLER